MSLTKSAIAAAALTAALSFTAQAAPPPAGVAPVTVPAGGFRILGDLVGGSSGAGDWLAGPGTAGVLDSAGVPLNPDTTFHFIDPFNSSSDNVFQGGKWTDDPNTWQWTTSKASNKTDINNVLMHVATDANAHTWLIVAADRLATSGDSYIDFELLQNTLVLTNKGKFASAGPDGGRTVNDLLLTLSYTGGGTIANFYAWRWQPTKNGGFTYVDSTASLPAGKVFISANSNVVSVPFGAFGQTTYPVNAFVEAAIDMTALMGNFDPCLSIGVKTIMVKTKTSQSTSAPNADFIEPIQYSLRIGPSSDAGPDQIVCSQGASTAFSLVGKATPGVLPISSTTWTVVSGSATIDSPSSLKTTAHVTSPSATLRLTVTQSNGCIETDDVVLTVGSLPTCSISGPNAVNPLSNSQFSGPAEMASYSWSITGNGAISGPANAQVVSVVAGTACGSAYTLSLTAANANCSSTCSTSVLVNDTVPPTITAPADLTLECPADTRTNVTGVAIAQDNSGNVSVSYSDAVTTGCAGVNTIVRTWTATDLCGSTASAVQTITVLDSTAPVITAPADVVLEAPGNTAPSNTGTATAHDGCSAATVTYTDIVSNSCGGAKLIKRLWTATDLCGNSADALQLITVRDTTAPTVTAPANLVLPLTGDASTNNTGSATATDAGSSATLSYQDTVASNPDGSYTITRTWTATDDCGNSASAAQTITLSALLPLVLPNQSDLSITDLTTLTITNSATNPNVPSSPLTYELIDPPAGLSIDSNGIITWTPTVDQSPSTNVITTVVSMTVDTAYGSSTTSSTNSFVVIVTGPYDGLDMAGDSDGDGLTNLVEYAVGGDPLNSADGTANIIVFITEDSGNHYLAMKFKRRTNAAALHLQYLPEVTADKVTWFSDDSHVLNVSVDPLDAVFDWVTVRDTTPIVPEQARFIRLHIISATMESTSPIWIGSDTLIQGAGSNASKVTLFSQRMVRPILSAGTVASVSFAVINDTNAAFVNGQFGTNGMPSYVEFDNGSMVDIADASAETVALAASTGNTASVGDAYRIRGHFTVNSLFGTNNSAGLKPGGNPAEADNILVYVPETQQTLTIFYYPTAPYTGWYNADFTPAGDQVVYPEQGLMVNRKLATDAHLYLCGPIKLGVAQVPVAGGYNLVGTLKSLSSLSLAGLNLYSGNPATGLAYGQNPGSTDNLLVIQPDGSASTYFYYKNDNQVGGPEGWVDAAFNFVPDVQINAGSALFILRRAQQGSFTWTIPAE